MDVLSTIITAIIMVCLFIYISTESNRRRKKGIYLEANYNIQAGIIFYFVTLFFLIVFHIAYYFEANPSSSPIRMSIISFIFLGFPLISYSLARRKIRIIDNEIRVYKVFKINIISISEITHIIDKSITTKIYSNDKKLLSIDRSLYDNIRQVLSEIKERIKQ